MAFIPPQGNKTVMVDNSNNIVYPTSFNRISVNQATIAGNNFTSVPSVINPANATTSQMPSVASVVNYIADVVEGGSSGLIPAIQDDIEMLGQEKANVGEFYFKNNGILSTSSPMQINGAFTCIWTTTRGANVYGGSTSTQRKGWVSTFPYQTSGTNKGFCLAMDDTYMGFYFRYLNSNGEVIQISITKTQIQYYDGKPHTYAFIFNGSNNVRLLIDNVEAFTGVVTDFAPFTTSHPLSITSPNQTCSRIKWFNFDMSANDAPYTITDYIAGKDESPLLNLEVQSYNVSDMTFSSASQTTYPCEVVSDSTAGTITVTTTGETSAEYTWIDGGANALAIPQGANVEVSVGHLDVATSVQGYFYSGSTRVQTLSGVSNDNPTISFISPANLTRLSLIVHAGVNPIPTGTILTITDLKIKVNGALLSLDDYSIRVGATQIVPDVSYNNNDATITGIVMGSKDTSIAKMAQLFYQSQQG